jgi:hypothetical protein
VRAPFYQVLDEPEGYIDVYIPPRWKIAAITFHDANGQGVVRLGVLHDG